MERKGSIIGTEGLRECDEMPQIHVKKNIKFSGQKAKILGGIVLCVFFKLFPLLNYSYYLI